MDTGQQSFRNRCFSLDGLSTVLFVALTMKKSVPLGAADFHNEEHCEHAATE
jgi:hypothetical protein